MHYQQPSFEAFDSSKYKQVPSSLLQKCLKPSVQTYSKKLRLSKPKCYQKAQKEAEYQNSKQSSNDQKNKQSIKIGYKAQKHRQNNKSQPKKVSSLLNLSEQTKISKPYQSILIGRYQKIQLKNKSRKKSNEKIFVCTKNQAKLKKQMDSSSYTNTLGTKIKNFEEDLKNTKKPFALKLNLETAESITRQEQRRVDGENLQNHQITPKVQPMIIFQDLQTPNQSWQNQKKAFLSPGFYPLNYCQTSWEEDSNGLEKTKKLVNQGHYDSRADHLLTSQHRPVNLEEQSKTYSIQHLLQQSQIKYILQKYRKESQIASEQKRISQQLPTPLEPHPSNQSAQPKPVQDAKRESNNNTKLFTFKDLEAPQNNQQFNLRLTDYDKSKETQIDADGPAWSEKRNSIFKTNQKPQKPFNKLLCLYQGAKTIITKYDSSQKRSVIDESIIIFQCSKDLKPCFSKQNFQKYPSKYRGSLGVHLRIKQNEEQEFQIHQKPMRQTDQSRLIDNDHFGNILLNLASNKMRKSFSIKEVQPSSLTYC